MSKILSLCIPTYNRASLLDILIQSIISQIEQSPQSSFLRKVIEICVSDNASSDHTQSVCESWAKRHSIDISYACNDSNIGADLNYLKSVSMATGQYAWIVGSDDALASGALDIVFSAILNCPDAVIFLTDFVACDSQLNPVKRKDWGDFPDDDPVYDFSSEAELHDYLNRAKSLGALFAYLSVVIFKKSEWDAIVYDQSYTGTAYAHAFMFLSILLSGRKHLQYIRKPVVLNRGDNDSFFQNKKQRLLLDLDGYLKLCDDLIADSQIKKKFLTVLRHWIPFRVIKRLVFHDLDNNYDKPFFSKLRQVGYPDYKVIFLIMANRFRVFFHWIDLFLHSMHPKILMKCWLMKKGCDREIS